jgi:hypothetical protein
VCCGTKRLVEIDCPADCPYLAAAREHPAAVVRRQQERDVAALLPAVRDLTERQHHLFLLFQSAIARHQPEGFTRLRDDDVSEAAAALAATLETAAKGVIYEHTTQSLPAQRLMTELKALLADVRKQGATVHDREAAVVLRAIAQGAREVRHVFGGSDTAYLSLVGRLLQQTGGPKGDAEPHRPPRSSLVLP